MKRVFATFATAAALAAFTIISPSMSASATGCQIGTLTTGPLTSSLWCDGGSGGGGSGTGNPSSPVPSACRYSFDPSAFPDSYYEFISDAYTQLVTTDREGSLTTRVHLKDGRVTGQERIYIDSSSKAYKIWLDNSSIEGIHQTANFECLMSVDGPTWNVYSDASDDELTPPTTVPPSDVIDDVDVTDSIASIPGSTRDYFLRVNLTNTTSHVTSSAIALNLSQTPTVEFLSGAIDASCAASNGIELCQIPQIPPASTESIVLHLSSDAGHGSPMPITVIGQGMQEFKWSAARPANWNRVGAQFTYIVSIP